MTDRYVPIGNRYKMATKITSTELRCEAANSVADTQFKLNSVNDQRLAMLPKIKKSKCTRAKNLALIVLHGDIYTGSRLLKFGLADNDECGKC